jgi:hypothetical protein
MNELLINQIAPIITTAVVSVLVFIIKKIGDAVIELLVTTKKEAELRIVSSGHEKELSTAKEVWNIVEEKFRITENCTSVLGSKTNEFDKLLLSKIPGLTQTNLDYLRQAVAGEVNKYKNIESTQQVTLTNTSESPEIPKAENTVVDSNITANSNSEANSNTNVNSNISVGSNTNLNNKDITASSNIQVDNPDNKKLVGTTVNAISAAVPS